VQYAKTVHDSRPSTPSPGMVYATYDFYLLIKYRYRIDIAIFWQYRIDIVSNSKKQYRCITTSNGSCYNCENRKSQAQMAVTEHSFNKKPATKGVLQFSQQVPLCSQKNECLPNAKKYPKSARRCTKKITGFVLLFTNENRLNVSCTSQVA